MTTSMALAKAGFGIAMSLLFMLIGVMATTNWKGFAVREVNRFCDEKGYARMRRPMLLARAAGAFFLVLATSILAPSLTVILNG
jgi:hypothetical protein